MNLNALIDHLNFMVWLYWLDARSNGYDLKTNTIYT